MILKAKKPAITDKLFLNLINHPIATNNNLYQKNWFDEIKAMK